MYLLKSSIQVSLEYLVGAIRRLIAINAFNRTIKISIILRPYTDSTKQQSQLRSNVQAIQGHTSNLRLVTHSQTEQTVNIKQKKTK